MFRRIAFIPVAGLLCLAGPGGPALAQKAPPKPDPALKAAAEKMAGAFDLTSADGQRRCSFPLSVDPAGSAFAVPFDKEACAALPFTAQVTGWVPDPSGSVRLLNAQGKTVAEFTPATGGSYEALREGDGVYFLASPAAADGTEVTIEEMVGDWDLARVAGTPVCRLTLTDRPAGKDTLALKVAPGCDGGILQFGPSGWRVEGGNILLFSGSGGSPLRFARQEDGGWSRIPERGRPLMMARP